MLVNAVVLLHALVNRFLTIGHFQTMSATKENEKSNLASEV